MADEEEEIPILIPDTTIPKEPTLAIARAPIPLTIITGFLGSGKTSLVMRLLNDPTVGRKIAIVLNEFGESGGIDQVLKKVGGGDNGEGDEWLELANGCFCCSVKDMGVKAIENLIKRSPGLDCVLFETTGLADPAPIASMFWLDEALQSELYLDGIVTVVDAKHISSYLTIEKEDGQINEAIKQVAMADRIILNKIDLVSSIEVEEIEMKIRTINTVAIIEKTTRANVPIDFIFDLHSFDEHQSDPFTQFVSNHSHKIDPTVTTVSFRATPGKVNLQLFEKWLQSLLWPPKTLLGPPNASRNISAPHVLRFKALLNAADTEYKVVAQSVQETYDITYSPTPWTVEEGARESKLVFIGKGLDMVALRNSFLYFCFDVNVNPKEDG